MGLVVDVGGNHPVVVRKKRSHSPSLCASAKITPNRKDGGLSTCRCCAVQCGSPLLSLGISPPPPSFAIHTIT